MMGEVLSLLGIRSVASLGVTRDVQGHSHNWTAATDDTSP